MSKLPFSEPRPSGSARARHAKAQRDLATEISRLRPQALTKSNREENDSDGKFAANFTKGLAHDDDGFLKVPNDYLEFVEAINSTDLTLFEKHITTAADRMDPNHAHGPTIGKYHCSILGVDCKTGEPEKTRKARPEPEHNPCDLADVPEPDINWRGWESPRAGHVFDLQGPDSGSVGMAPAPRVGSSELAAELAEVYALALLRDVPFTRIAEGSGERVCGKEHGKAVLSAGEVADLLNKLDFYKLGKKVVSSTPWNRGEDGLNRFERNRRDARFLCSDSDGKVSAETMFRGSTKGAHTGPYISQFMLAGSLSLACPGGGVPSYPGKKSHFDPEDGYIAYGTQIIDQRVTVHKPCLDHMTEWAHWLDVQNGANLRRADSFLGERRFITTPRDLATYVHFDALYQAYLNAALILLSLGIPADNGFPEPSPSGRRDPFATFGGPHILSLVTEVATRCLKAVRRQKFNYHRRARPEALAARLVFPWAYPTKTGQDAKKNAGTLDKLFGNGRSAFEATLDAIPKKLLEAVVKHNKTQNSAAVAKWRRVVCKDVFPCNMDRKWFDRHNLLLPMAFPEGSPMHPAYGAGHATVAGGCVTMLKAFFSMYDADRGGQERILKLSDKDYFVPKDDGSELVNVDGEPLTIQGELDKLAANISIGRNMAGVHYYSDYYDSLRLGERIAVGILLEQIPTYGEAVESTFCSFDGDSVAIYGEGGSCPSMSVVNREGCRENLNDWWLRHVEGEALVEDYGAQAVA